MDASVSEEMGSNSGSGEGVKGSEVRLGVGKGCCGRRKRKEK